MREVLRNRRCFARALTACAGVTAGLVSVASAGPVDVFWLNASSGNWGTAGNWDPAVVPNNNGTEYNAFLQVSGTAYVVSLDSNFTVRDFTMSSTDATLDLLSNRLTIEGDFTQGANTIGSTGGLGELFVSGSASLTGSTLTGFTTMRTSADLNLSGATFNGVMAVMSLGTLNFIGAAASEICDTCIDHEGAAINWSGDGGIMMGAGGEIRNADSSKFTISNNQSITLIGGTASVRNEGVIEKTSSGTTSMVGVSLVNTGTLDIKSGTFSVDKVDNLPDGTLSGGKWIVRAGATLDFSGATVTMNEAEVTLEGAGSSFSAFTDNISVNGATGTISLLDGRALTTAGDFTNEGALVVGTGSAFMVASGSSLTNFTAATKTLTGGAYDLAGTLTFDGADVVTLGAEVTLRGTGGGIENEFGANALLQSSAGTNTIASGGMLAIRDAVTFTTGGDMLVASGGMLDIDTGTTFKVASGFDLLNISSSGVLNDAGVVLRGTLQADNADVVEIGAGADLTLDGDGSSLLNGAGMSAFAGLERIDSGSFTIKGGRDLTVSNSTPFTVSGATGKLTVGPRATVDGPGPGMGDRSELTVTGDIEQSAGAVRVDDALVSVGGSAGYTQSGGVLTLANAGELAFTGAGSYTQTGGTLAGTGKIMGSAVINGTLSPGESAGAITVTGDVTVRPDAIFEFEIISASEFDQLIVDGSVTFEGPDGGKGGAVLRVRALSGYAAVIGDTFEVITFTETRDGGFAFLEGLSLGNGLFLESEFTDHALVLRVVPAPGAGLGLGVALLGAGRRRRG